MMNKLRALPQRSKNLYARAKLQQEATRTELKHLQSTIESRKKSAVFHHPTHARNDNPQSGSQSTGFHSSVAVKGKDTASSVHGSSHNPGVSSEVVVDAFLKEIDTCNDALKARRKRKHSESSKATWSMGVSNPDLTSSQMASTSALPPPPNPHNASSTNAGPLAAKDTSSGSIAPVPPCVFHAKPLMSLPKIIPRARPTSPDWSEIPLRERPLQGRERPDEFEDELQKTWIVTGNPDLSTSLGHSIFSDEINSKQMWENPQIPRIEVVVPDEVRDQMYEEAARGQKSTGLDQSLAPPMEFIYTDSEQVFLSHVQPDFTLISSCIFSYLDQHQQIDIPKQRATDPSELALQLRWRLSEQPQCECRAFQTWMVREVAQGMNIELTEDITSFEGFAYHSTRKPRHSHAKKSDNGDWETRSVSDIFVNFGFPVFECNSLCGCGPDCINRTVGRAAGRNFDRENNLTWLGVFADHLIPAGRLVTHYTANVDAFLYGNISRFINHSCSANTSIVPVYIDDSDPTRPLIAPFYHIAFLKPEKNEKKRNKRRQLRKENHLHQNKSQEVMERFELEFFSSVINVWLFEEVKNANEIKKR
ncbi:hypothetical protein KEM48_005578 [Puccinia striiformis f. sp. tritici PST-130]|nr:hypothetical protein KEM48_005578 [Puccinia striiformis f. sp. tritici PST-130]